MNRAEQIRKDQETLAILHSAWNTMLDFGIDYYSQPDNYDKFYDADFLLEQCGYNDSVKDKLDWHGFELTLGAEIDSKLGFDGYEEL